MDLKSLAVGIKTIAQEKAIPVEKVVSAVEVAIAAAYKKEYRKRSEIIKAKLDLKTGLAEFFQVKTVVDPAEVRIVEESVESEEGGKKEKEVAYEENEVDILPRYNADRHIFFEEAKAIQVDIKMGDELDFPLEANQDFGRIAAQTAKQVILQNIREAERSSVQEEFAGKESTIVSGVIQRFDRGNVYVDLGRAIGIMFYNESIREEHYRMGQRMRFYVLAVQSDARRPGIILSRSHPNFIKKLFELEVPEIADGTVEIKSIAREPGYRTKIAVASKEEGIDPVGSAVGQRGTRVMAVTNELGNEKIDVIEWSEEPEKFIANAMSPAKARIVEILPRREVRVFVAEDQLSLAIGKGGQNVRLAAQLTGWKIDVRSQSRPDEMQEGGVAEIPEKIEIENAKKESDNEAV